MKRASEITDDSIPRSFVFHRGDVGKLMMQLITDMRHVMEPYTATNLKVNPTRCFWPIKSAFEAVKTMVSFCKVVIPTLKILHYLLQDFSRVYDQFVGTSLYEVIEATIEFAENF